MSEMTMQEAAELLSREERFMATTQAMNTLLIAKGVYSQEEFDSLFIMWAQNQQRRPKGDRPGWNNDVESTRKEESAQKIRE